MHRCGFPTSGPVLDRGRHGDGDFTPFDPLLRLQPPVAAAKAHSRTRKSPHRQTRRLAAPSIAITRRRGSRRCRRPRARNRRTRRSAGDTRSRRQGSTTSPGPCHYNSCAKQQRRYSRSRTAEQPHWRASAKASRQPPQQCCVGRSIAGIRHSRPNEKGQPRDESSTRSRARSPVHTPLCCSIVRSLG
jgi:hypothetical protein